MDVVDQILEEAGRFTSEVLAPLNGVGDKEGCHWAARQFTVTTPKGFKDAYRQLVAEAAGRRWAPIRPPMAARACPMW